MLHANRTRLVFAFLSVVAACILGVASSYFVAALWADDHEPAHAQGVDVEGPEGIVVSRGQTPADAIDTASDKVGYEVKGLDYTPGDAFELRRIMVNPRPDGAPRTAYLTYEQPDPTAFYGALRIYVFESDRQTTHPPNWRPEDDPNQLFDIGVPDVQVWMSGDDLRRTYAMNTDGRAFVVSIDERQPPEDEVRRMLRELID